MPRPGRVMPDYDLVIASQPYRARASVEWWLRWSARYEPAED
jgi:hypothetical protein